MPNDVKAVLSVITILAALAYGYWEATVGHGVSFTYVLVFGIFAVIAMWVFPEAGVKKGDMPAKRPGG